MSAPTPAPGEDRPREGYYPDPSIPGYVRYWNGAAWVPGTSRPAPSGGEALSPPPGARPAHVPAPASSPELPDPRGQSGAPAVEETGPHFFDEDPQPRRAASADSQHGSRPGPAASWGADRSRQSGFGGGQDRRVSWGSPGTSETRDPRVAGPADAVSQPEGASARADGTTTIPPADSGTASPPPASAGPVVFRRPNRPVPSGGPKDAGGGTSRTGEAGPDPASAADAPVFRAPSPRTEGQAGGTAPTGVPDVSTTPGPSTAPAASGSSTAPGPGAPEWPAAPAASGPSAASGPAAGAGPSAVPGADPSGARTGGPTAGPSAASTASPGAGQGAVPPGAGAQAAASAPVVPQQPGGSTPMASGAGGGQPSWAQQVHQLAGDPADEGQRVAPWKPPVEDPFQAAARRQAAARPAGLGRRLAARLLDTVVIAGVTAAAAVPLGTMAVDHIDEKIETAKLSGEKVTVWLLDATTASCLGAVLAVLLVFGVLYEVLPTVRWGRTLGKKLCGIEVRDIEGHEPPAFGRALGRWLVLSVPSLLVVGLFGVVWCLFDKPWNQGWHDKAAHTFVAGPAR
ncbi:RDD family protein [Streptomyces sp. NPDC058751]|uniref:RDD family protein n=1 Tax=Streptomyces sp. NPDC058751 TaxID=3346623 RepID=UPI0036C7F985